MEKLEEQEADSAANWKIPSRSMFSSATAADAEKHDVPVVL